MISRPSYVPHSLQTRWGTCFAPHCGHVAREGGATFHWALRRLVRERDIFFLGTAMTRSWSNGADQLRKASGGAADLLQVELVEHVPARVADGLDVPHEFVCQTMESELEPD